MKNIYPLSDIETVKDQLLSRQATIAVAESVTAGHLQAALSQAADARQFFQGGMTAYNIGQKCRLLGVEPVHALECNGVSAIVAEEMAKGAIEAFRSRFGVGITGYAAPVPEKKVDQPYAFYSVFGPEGKLRTERLEPPPADAFEVQVFYVEKIFAALKDVLRAAPQASS